MNRETPRNKDDKAQEHDQGMRERSGWCSSGRVLVQLTESAGWWMGDNDSHGIEISIARGVRKMVRVLGERDLDQRTIYLSQGACLTSVLKGCEIKNCKQCAAAMDLESI